MQFSSRQLADVVVAAPSGRIDHTNAAQLEQAIAPLLDASPGHHAAVVLDFSGVDYISSVGLRVLMIAAKTLRERKAGFAVAGLQPIVAEIVTISRFDRVLDVFPSVRDALAKYSATALAAFDGNTGGAST